MTDHSRADDLKRYRRNAGEFRHDTPIPDGLYCEAQDAEQIIHETEATVTAHEQRIAELTREIDGETVTERQQRVYRNSMYPQDPDEPKPTGLRERIANLTTQRDGLQTMVEIYFDVAAEEIGYDEVVNRYSTMLGKRQQDTKEQS